MTAPDALRSFFDHDRFAARNGITLDEVREGFARASMRVTPEHLNGVGTAQGGSIFTLADLAFAAATNSHGTVAVAINVSISFMKAARSGLLTAHAHETASNQKLATCTVNVTDEAGDLVAVFQGLAYRKATTLAEVEAARDK